MIKMLPRLLAHRSEPCDSSGCTPDTGGSIPAIRSQWCRDSPLSVPTVIWGYFAYMSIAFLTGSEFWERLQLLITDPRRRAPSQGGQPRYLRAVPMRTAFAFTLFQLACLLGVWALVTFAGVSVVLWRQTSEEKVVRRVDV